MQSIVAGYQDQKGQRYFTGAWVMESGTGICGAVIVGMTFGEAKIITWNRTVLALLSSLPDPDVTDTATPIFIGKIPNAMMMKKIPAYSVRANDGCMVAGGKTGEGYNNRSYT